MVCLFASLGIIHINAFEITCVSQSSSWCKIFTPADIQHDNYDELVINYADAKTKVTNFHWIDRSVLKSFPSKIFDTFSNISLIHLAVGVTELKESDFASAGNLMFLYLAKNGVTRLTEGVFSKLSKIIRINLDFNQIVEIQDYAFKNLNTLEDIVLEGNYINTLTRNTFTGAPNLLNLYLSRNEIETIENGAFNLEKLQYLDLSDNRLTTIENGLFANAPALSSIYLEVNYFNQVPMEILKSPSLKTVSLIDNDITSVDLIDFAKMPKLDYLDLTSTGAKLSPIKSVPAQIDSPLTEIGLSGNGYSDPNILQQLYIFKKLKTIQLDTNDFTHIDHIDEIKQHVPELETIALNFCYKIDCNWLRHIRPVTTNLSISLFSTDNFENGSNEDDKKCGVVTGHA